MFKISLEAKLWLLSVLIAINVVLAIANYR